MLSLAEKKGCLEILRLLSTEDVFALAGTITKRTIQVKDRSEAESAILSFSESADQILKRKKITKEVLVNYLFRLGESVPQTDKDGLKAYILRRWNMQVVASPSVPKPSTSAHALAVNQPPNIVNQTFNINVNFSNTSGGGSLGANNHPIADHGQSFAHEFVKWFYRLLNSYNPWQGAQVENFGPEHFINNAELRLAMTTPGSHTEEAVEGSGPIVQRLLSFPKDNFLLFNPNISNEGVQIKSDPHGLKLILVCGTLHKENNCVGVFKQSFGLVRNPCAPDSWQIKVICLKMDEQATGGLPQLKEFGEVAAMEGHTIKVLQESLPYV